MLDGALYLVSSFWLGAVHAATPGHGKTVSAAYLVGTRGRPSDALALGIFVTLSHTSGIIAFALLAVLGSSVFSQRSQGYVALVTAIFMFAVGAWMLVAAWRGREHTHGGGLVHRHGFGAPHSHELRGDRPSWTLLFGLGVAGGLLPDPAALAVLLSALANGKLVLGLLTVLVFSLGFASVLGLVGALVGQMGRLAFAAVPDHALRSIQVGTAAVITVVGAVMTIGAWQQLAVS